ncbi:flagellar basal-body rod protein [Candidatus Nitromaritima sp. SCGC AAA799-C22]|nr:flagellar basal-body rod protein [Candidatus Nitromaritima sp. SCGC AAA799-C22]
MLIDKLLFSDQTPLALKKGLDFQSARNLLISTNISNMDTPGYKAHDINFEKQLREVIKTGDQLQMKSTNSKHFGPSNAALKALRPQPFELTDPAKSNGNNVDIDSEMAKLAENQIMYTAIIQLMMKRGSTVRSAVTELAQQ